MANASHPNSRLTSTRLSTRIFRVCLRRLRLRQFSGRGGSLLLLSTTARENESKL